MMIDNQKVGREWIWLIPITLVSLIVITICFADTRDGPKIHPRIAQEIISLFEDTAHKLRGDTSGTTIAQLDFMITRLKREVQGQDDPLVLMNICTDITAETVKFRHQSRRRLEKMR